MSEFPKQFALPDPLVHISTLSECSVGGIQWGALSATSGAWPTNNKAIYIPFRLTRPFVFDKLFILNGATASGNIDLGVYSADGTKIVSKGSTAQSGTNAIQSLAVSSTELGPGLFYMAAAFSSTSGTSFRINPSVSGITVINQAGIAMQTSAFALPATATFASAVDTYVPIMGLTGRSVI